MTIFKLTILFYLLFTSLIKANEVQIIELHKNINLDQLVLDSENANDEITENINNESIEKNNLDNDIESNKEDELDKNNIEDEINSNTQNVVVLNTETIFDLDENIILNHLENIKNIKSKVLHREFIKILSNTQIEDATINDNKIYFIIKKLYEIGEIGKAYNLLKTINFNDISNKENLNYYYFIELNYLFSTFRLSEACDLKTSLLNRAVVLPKYLLEKTDIFCLTLENKFAEAKLLNSLLIDTEKEIDNNFQTLFNYMIFIDQNDNSFESLTNIKSKELIFLYSAMLRINELALDEDFIEIDPLNLSIPVILSNSTKMDIRIKAANKAFYDGVISIESLSALYQSVDFNSKQLNEPDKTIPSLNNNKELIMAYYYQLANIQIFPDQRLKVILDYWQFAKIHGLERIAYSITKNIIETFIPTSENNKYALEIALAHISNENYVESSKWISLYENFNTNPGKTEYAKFLITLNETDNLDTIINYLSNNYDALSKIDDQQTLETLAVLVNFLKLDLNPAEQFIYKNIIDERTMPSYFLIMDIKKHIDNQNDLSLFMLSLISINNKKWKDIHPEHLHVILNSINLYNQGSIIKPIILEILNELEIF